MQGQIPPPSTSVSSCQYHSTNTPHSSSPSPGDLHTQDSSCRISGEHWADRYFQFIWSLSAKHTDNCTLTSAGTNPVSGPLLPTLVLLTVMIGQEIPRSVHNSPPLIPTLSQTNPLHALTPCVCYVLCTVTFLATPTVSQPKPCTCFSLIRATFLLHLPTVRTSPSRNSVQPLSLAPS